MNTAITLLTAISLVVGIALGLTLLKPSKGKNPPCNPRYPECAEQRKSPTNCDSNNSRDCFPRRRRGTGTYQNETPPNEE